MRCHAFLALLRTTLASAALFGSATAQVTFVTVPAAQSGLDGASTDLAALGTGMCAADFDGDGDFDVVVPQNFGEPILYFRNDGGTPSFVNATAQAGLGTSRFARACRAADIDNDGDQDLIIANENAATQLFINDGAANFVDEALARGIAHVSLSFGAGVGDYDRDGWLDIYFGNRVPDNILYRNIGGGYFVDVTAQAGVAFPGSVSFFGTFFDYDEDGWPDIYVCNDKGVQVLPNEMFRNNGDGTFTAVGAAIDAADAVDAMGLDFLDVFNDGGMDFFVTDSPSDHLFRVWDPAQQLFTNETATYGLQGGYVGWACQFLDADNDGWQDLSVTHNAGPNMVYLNPGTAAASQTPWTQLVTVPFPDLQTTTAIADFDGDGRVDILERIAIPQLHWPHSFRLLRNTTPTTNNWLRLDTVGTTSNRDGIGARVTVRTASITQQQHVRAGVGYQASGDRRPHFGLGLDASADVDVVWPSGATQRLHDVDANQTLTVFEPRLQLGGPARIGRTTSIEFACHNDIGFGYAVMLAFQAGAGTSVGDRVFPLTLDALSALTLTPNNGILSRNVGMLKSGTGTTLLTLPADPNLIGVQFLAGALTYSDAGALGSFSQALRIVVQP